MFTFWVSKCLKANVCLVYVELKVCYSKFHEDVCYCSHLKNGKGNVLSYFTIWGGGGAYALWSQVREVPWFRVPVGPFPGGGGVCLLSWAASKGWGRYPNLGQCTPWPASRTGVYPPPTPWPGQGVPHRTRTVVRHGRYASCVHGGGLSCLMKVFSRVVSKSGVTFLVTIVSVRLVGCGQLHAMDCVDSPLG